MISRLTALAAIFAVVTTASLAYAANVKVAQREAAPSAAEPQQIVVLERVIVTGKRSAANASN